LHTQHVALPIELLMQPKWPKDLATKIMASY